jgi:hypothetical protein
LAVLATLATADTMTGMCHLRGHPIRTRDMPQIEASIRLWRQIGADRSVRTVQEIE